MLHRLVLVTGSGEVRSDMWVPHGAFSRGNKRASLFPGVQEHQQVVFDHNALLCGALEVLGLQVMSVHRLLMVSGHSHLWTQR